MSTPQMIPFVDANNRTHMVDIKLLEHKHADLAWLANFLAGNLKVKPKRPGERHIVTSKQIVLKEAAYLGIELRVVAEREPREAFDTIMPDGTVIPAVDKTLLEDADKYAWFQRAKDVRVEKLQGEKRKRGD